MKKFGKVLLHILETIIAIPCGIVVAILLTPLTIICLLISIPLTFVQDIWGLNQYE